MSRKYRQPGYMDNEREDRDDRRNGQGRDTPKPKQPSAGPRWRNAQDGPRTPRMAGTRTVARCHHCGAVLPALSEELGKCGKCEADLRCCKMCVHFDPASQFECTEPIEARVSPKDGHTDCGFFRLKTTVEKDTSGQTEVSASPVAPTSSMSPDDARKAFENLFKK